MRSTLPRNTGYGSGGPARPLNLACAKQHATRTERSSSWPAPQRSRAGALALSRQVGYLLRQLYSAGFQHDEALEVTKRGLETARTPTDIEVQALAVGACDGFAALMAEDHETALVQYTACFDLFDQMPFRAATIPWYDLALVGEIWDPEGLGARAYTASFDPGVHGAIADWLPLAEVVRSGRNGDRAKATELVPSYWCHGFSIVRPARLKNAEFGRVGRCGAGVCRSTCIQVTETNR